MNKLNLILIAVLGFFSFFCSAKSGDAGYDSAVKFTKGEKIKFPDFTLEFTGERNVQKQFPNGNSVNFKFFDFKLTDETGSKDVSWSAGTGDIAPQPFELGGKSFMLELKNSEKLNTKLADDELVIVKK